MPEDTHDPEPFEIPEVSFYVPKVVITALKHATAKEPPMSSINFLIREDGIYVAAANGQVAVYIRLHPQDTEPCSFSGNFEAVSALQPDEAECLTIRTVAAKELLPMPYALIDGMNGTLKVAIDQPIRALETLRRVDMTKERDGQIAVALDRLDAVMKVAKAYEKGCSIEIQGQEKGLTLVTIRDDPNFLGLVASTIDPTGAVPIWARSDVRIEGRMP